MSRIHWIFASILLASVIRGLRSWWSLGLFGVLLLILAVPAVRSGAGRLWGRSGAARLPFWALFAIALGPRLAWVLISGNEPWSDFARYDEIARDILAGRYLVRADTQSGISLFLAAHYAVFGHVRMAPQITIAVLGALQVPIVAWMGARLQDRTAGVVAGLLLAFWPESVLYVNLLGTDVLFSFFILLGVEGVLWSRLDPGRQKTALFAAGLAFGAAHWLRPYGVIFATIALLWVVATFPGRPRARLVRGGALAAGLVLLLLPLMVLYQQQIGVPTLTPQHGGASLYVGANLETKGGWSAKDIARIDDAVRAEPDRPGEHPDRKRNRVAKRLARERIARNGLQAQARMALCHKIPHLWGVPADVAWPVARSRVKTWQPTLKEFAKRYHTGALFFAAMAMILLVPQCPSDIRRLLILFALAGTGLHAIYEVQARYHHLFLPTIALLAGWGAAIYLSRPTEAVKRARTSVPPSERRDRPEGLPPS